MLRVNLVKTLNLHVQNSNQCFMCPPPPRPPGRCCETSPVHKHSTSLPRCFKWPMVVAWQHKYVYKAFPSLKCGYWKNVGHVSFKHGCLKLVAKDWLASKHVDRRWATVVLRTNTLFTPVPNRDRSYSSSSWIEDDWFIKWIKTISSGHTKGKGRA